jgi:hypothetical protein
MDHWRHEEEGRRGHSRGWMNIITKELLPPFFFFKKL